MTYLKDAAWEDVIVNVFGEDWRDQARQQGWERRLPEFIEKAFEMREKIAEFLKKWKLLLQDQEDWEERLLFQD